MTSSSFILSTYSSYVVIEYDEALFIEIFLSKRLISVNRFLRENELKNIVQNENIYVYAEASSDSETWNNGLE